jgi:hypothetical protein
MQVSLEASDRTDVPGWLKNELTTGEFFLELVLLVAGCAVIVLGFAAVVMWLAGYTERLRERYFPVHSCDQLALTAISEMLQSLSRESMRYDFIALRVRFGTWHGKERIYVWGTFGAVTPGEGAVHSPS